MNFHYSLFIILHFLFFILHYPFTKNEKSFHLNTVHYLHIYPYMRQKKMLKKF